MEQLREEQKRAAAPLQGGGRGAFQGGAGQSEAHLRTELNHDGAARHLPTSSRVRRWRGRICSGSTVVCAHRASIRTWLGGTILSGKQRAVAFSSPSSFLRKKYGHSRNVETNEYEDQRRRNLVGTCNRLPKLNNRLRIVKIIAIDSPAMPEISLAENSSTIQRYVRTYLPVAERRGNGGVADVGRAAVATV
ncbi:uncharacterized protein LOC110117136 [Athalia rosae]|uniref:uncharacterized protein LOC110117136 n=1 Tax=Athalia rosae TaxID=37344 RepID=UPI00203396DA|nr:uncharacterized protein LOC110117136 [Athalia rosae]